jgi:uncharacterized protein YggU (UPF0235/DUF167 family)
MIIKVKVNASSKKESVEKNDSFYIIKFKAQREKGEANSRLISLLSSYFKVPKQNVKIISGFTNTVKIIEIIND